MELEELPIPRKYHAHNRGPQRDYPHCPGCGVACLDINTLAIHQHFCQPYKDGHKPTPPGPTKPNMKVCNTCGKEKPIDEFPKKPNLRDGHSNQCRDCINEYHRKRNEAKQNART